MVDYPPNNPFQVDANLTNRLSAAKEAVWFRIGVLQSTMRDRERALNAFERVLAVNPNNVRAMTQAGAVLAKKECYHEAINYLQRAISADDSSGDTWAVLAHCFVMIDDLQKAYLAYQNALSNMPNPRCPNLWYGIGLLYDRYGNLDNALEAFLAVLSISPDFERVDEVCFCIGIIYKEQQKFDEALKYFNRVVVAWNPPPPLTRADGWYQIGHVHELKRDPNSAIEMYKQALKENPKHPKTLQNYGWLEHSHNNNSAEAIRLLRQSTEYDPSHAQTWYLLGRVHMSLSEFRQAYNAYQQAVYRDSQNATFWCSIGVLYYQMQQRRDAMDAYTRAIGINPYVSEVWYDLGTLYESCEQRTDAIHAYRQAARLAPDNTQITERLRELESSAANQQAHSTSQQPQTTQPPPIQMQPDMHNVTQGHMNPLNRSIGPSRHQMRDSLPQQKLAHHQPATQPSQRQSRQIPSLQGSANMEGIQERGASVEMGPIPPMRHPNMTAPVPPNGFLQHQRNSMPVPLSSTGQQTPHALMSPGHHLSRPLASPQQPSPMPVSAPQHAAPHGHYGAPMHPSAAVPHPQLKPLAYQSLPAEQASQPQQQTQHSRIQLPRLSHTSAQGKLSAGAQLPQPPHGSEGHEQPSAGVSAGDAQPLPPRIPVVHGGEHSDPQGLPRQPNTLSQRQALPQMQKLPPLRHATTLSAAVQVEAQRQVANGRMPELDECQRRSDRTDENEQGRQRGQDNSPTRFGRGENFQSRENIPVKSRALKVSQLNNATVRKERSPGADLSASQRMTGSAGEQGQRDGTEREPSSPVHGAARDEPNGVRSKRIILSDQDGKSTESSDERVRKTGGSPKRERDQRSGSSSHNGHMMPTRSVSPDGSSSEKPTNTNSVDDENDEKTREESNANHSPRGSAKRNHNSLPPNSGVNNGKQLHSVSTSMGNGPSIAPLPPLSSRGPSARGSASPQASKDSGGGNQPGFGLTSSLTKFSKVVAHGPRTPVDIVAVPSSLASPLPTRRVSDSASNVHGHRSPRAPRQNQLPTFRAIRIPSHGYGGQVDSVPSPSSLPVLPALSSRISHGGDGKSAMEKERRSTTREEVKSRMDDEELHSGKERKPSPKRTGDGGPRRKVEHASNNKPTFGMHRSSPALKTDQEKTNIKASGREERMRSPSAPPYERRGERLRSPSVPNLGRRDGSICSKRDEMPKEDSGRTAKRPRLHESQNGDKHEKGVRLMKEEQRGKDRSKGMLTNELSSLRKMKSDKGASRSASFSDMEVSGSKENGSTEAEESGKVAMSSQVVNLPRLSNSKSKLSEASQLPANTPLPSFRSERMNLTASRSSTGVGTSGRHAVADGNRSTAPAALRSAAVSVQSRQSSSDSLTRSMSRQEAHSSRGRGEALRKDEDDNVEGAPHGKSSRDEKRIELVSNGESMKGRLNAGSVNVRSGSELGKDDKPGRAEIRSSAT